MNHPFVPALEVEHLACVAIQLIQPPYSEIAFQEVLPKAYRFIRLAEQFLSSEEGKGHDAVVEVYTYRDYKIEVHAYDEQPTTFYAAMGPIDAPITGAPTKESESIEDVKKDAEVRVDRRIALKEQRDAKRVK